MPLRIPAASLAQAMIVAAALALLAFWPPRRGAMLLVPLRGTLAQTVNAALAGHASLLGQGPVPGSIVVFGDRARLVAAIGNKAVVVLAAPATGCGKFTLDEDAS